MGRINNIRNEITNFIKEFCVKVEGADTVDVKDCFIYQGVAYYIPSEGSLMDEDDFLLCTMLLSTFPVDEQF